MSEIHWPTYINTWIYIWKTHAIDLDSKICTRHTTPLWNPHIHAQNNISTNSSHMTCLTHMIGHTNYLSNRKLNHMNLLQLSQLDNLHLYDSNISVDSWYLILYESLINAHLTISTQYLISRKYYVSITISYDSYFISHLSRPFNHKEFYILKQSKGGKEKSQKIIVSTTYINK